MTYYRGTLEEFNTWHDAVKITEAMPKIGYINGQPAPENQQTVAYCEAIQNPDRSNDYIWTYGKYPIQGRQVLNQTNIDNLKWFPEF